MKQRNFAASGLMAHFTPFKRKIFAVFALLSAVVFALFLVFKIAAASATGSFNPSNLISDGEFLNINSMDAGEIQRFLEDKGSYLQSYTEDGKTAAQIIYGASHGEDHASGECNGSTVCYGIDINTSTGTVNPKVLLVTLQKEQSLISKSVRDDDALRKAMGYGCPDSGGCNSAYAGFKNQVENAAWQLRFNYERAQGHGYSDYQVGQSFCFSDWNGTNCGNYDNRATAALYRYTPHVYNGNYNFWNLYFNTYDFETPEYAAELVSQSAYVTLMPGQSTNFSISFRNIGRNSWNTPSGSYPLRLAIDKYWGASTVWQGSGWLSENRIGALSSTVASGETASFTVPVTAPSNIAPGEYRFYVRLVADGAKWFSDSGAAWWKITVPPMTASYIGQSPYPTLTRGSDATLFVKFRNTSGVTWRAAGSNPVRLAIDKYWAARTAWQGSGWLSENRITVADEGDVQNGAVGTYTFNIHVPIDMPLGDHYFYVRLVADGYSWFDNPKTNGGAWWRFTVTE